MAESIFESFYAAIVGIIDQVVPKFILPNISLIIQIVLLLIIGFIAGKIVKAVAMKLLNIVGLKRITTRSWAESILKAAGYRGSIVELIGDLVKWLVYILFLALIIQVIGLPGVADIFTSVAAFIPRFIAAILVIAIGFIIADFFGKVFEEATRRFMDEDIISAIAGGLVKYSISLIAIIMSLSLVGLDINAITIMFSMILAAIIVIMIIGIKDTFPNFTAGMQVRKMFRPGEQIKVGDYSGVVEKLQPFFVVLKVGDKRIAIPNSYFIAHPVEKRTKFS